MSSPRTSRGRLPMILAITVAALVPMPTSTAWGHAVEPLPFELQFPQEPQVTVFSSTFGASRSRGRRHQGTDLMAPKMTQVYAAGAGVVATVAESGTAGRYVEIEHHDGWTTMYVHLNNDNPGTDAGDAEWSLTVAPGVEEGTWVAAGQLIGWVGDSGNAEGTAPHTHFEIHRNGRVIDPYNFLLDAFERGRQRYFALVRSAQDPLMG